MSENKFYLIETDNDGEVTLRPYDNENLLLKDLDDEAEDCNPKYIRQFEASMDDCTDLRAYPMRFIIYGKIVVPKAKEVIVKHMIEK